MRYLIITSILLQGCVTPRPSAQSCMIAVRSNLTNDDYTMFNNSSYTIYSKGLWYVCDEAGNDPLEAMKLLRTEIR